MIWTAIGIFLNSNRFKHHDWIHCADSNQDFHRENAPTPRCISPIVSPELVNFRTTVRWCWCVWRNFVCFLCLRGVEKLQNLAIFNIFSHVLPWMIDIFLGIWILCFFVFWGGFTSGSKKFKAFTPNWPPSVFIFSWRILHGANLRVHQVFPCCGRTVGGLLLGLFTIEATWIFGASNSNWTTKKLYQKTSLFVTVTFFFVKENPFLSFKVPWWPVGDQNLCVQHRLFQGVMGMGGGQGINSCW